MTAKVGYSTPLLHVSSVEQSIRFYEQLGFATVDTDRCDPLGRVADRRAGGRDVPEDHAVRISGGAQQPERVLSGNHFRWERQARQGRPRQGHERLSTPLSSTRIPHQSSLMRDFSSTAIAAN